MPDPQTGGQADLRGQSQTCALEKRGLDPYFPVRAQLFFDFFRKMGLLHFHQDQISLIDVRLAAGAVLWRHRISKSRQTLCAGCRTCLKEVCFLWPAMIFVPVKGLFA